MTQITRKSTPMRGLILLLTVTLGAGLVLVGCGDDDTATTPAPAPPPPPPAPAPEPEPEPTPEPEPEPMAPATPTGLMVSETSETSITWTWDAVEGAIGYAVQVSHDEMFGADDTIVPTAENTFTAADLPPETSVFIRVAAAGGTLEAPLLSAWTTHVTGMSAMPPPEPEPTPEAPDPIEVTFSLETGTYLLAGTGQGSAEKADPERAMASVNPKIMVMSNTDALIAPMFVENASAVRVAKSEEMGMGEEMEEMSDMADASNTPFAFVDWQLLQTDVFDQGAIFKITRLTMGANQEMEPTDDSVYVTCGPFECVDGMEVPEISVADSPKCLAWDPMLELQVGYVDNSLDNSETDLVASTAAHNANGDEGKFDGLDAGWVYTSDLGATVIHHFGNTSVTGRGMSKNLLKTSLSMSNHDTGATAPDDPIDDDDFQAKLLVGRLYGADAVYPCGIDNLDSDLTHLEADVDETYDGSPGRPAQPDNCFRIVDSTLEDYSVELIPGGAITAWGTINWKKYRLDDPFEGLTCDSVTFAAADQVDVCAMFEEELDYNLKNLFTGASSSSTASSTFTIDVRTESNFDNRISGWSVATAGGMRSARQFDTVWYDHDGMASTDSIDLYGAAPVPNLDLTHLLSDLGADGDFGKVDLRRNHADTGAKNERQGEDGKADNYGGTSEACTDDDGLAGCDAKFSESVDIVFATGTDFRCEVTRTVSVSCTWDAQGRLPRRGTPETGADADTPLPADGGGLVNFVSCKVTGPS